MKFYTFLLVFEPVLHFRTSVIRGVVNNQVYLLILVSGNKLVQKGQKTLCIEPVDKPEVKFGMVADCYGSHNFYGLPRRWGLHHTSDTFQGPMS